MSKKIFITFLAILSICFPVFSQEMPSDVKEDHYAYDAISDLVDRGINVTQGYPDGTFRGNKNTNRYENAYFMAQLALSMKRAGTEDIDVSDLKEELAWLRNEITAIKEQPEVKSDMIFYGSVDLNSKFGNLVAYDAKTRPSIGPETNYRMKYSIEKTLGKDANIKLNLDTMDGGFNSSTSRDFIKRLLDFEGNLNADIGLENPVQIKAIVGPGSVLHRDTSSIAPSEDGTYFSRPRTSFIVSSLIGGLDVSCGYVARSVQNNGSVGTSEVNLNIGGKIGQFPLVGSVEAVSTSRYAFTEFMDPTSGPNEFMQELSFTMIQSKNISEKLVLGSASTDNPISQYYMNYEIYVRDINHNKTDVTFKFNSVGIGYRQPFVDLEFLPQNLFDRKILDGMIDVGFEIIHPLDSRLLLTSKSDWVGTSYWEMGSKSAGTSFTQEFSFDYGIINDLTLKTFYRYYLVPSRLDMFGNAVPEVSDLVGIGLNYRF